VANLSVRCCPQPGKAKSRLVLDALASGAGGDDPNGLPAFFGVVGIESDWRAARMSGDFLYCDNSFFDATRGNYFRVGVRELQTVAKKPDWDRRAKINLGIQPWRRGGTHIVVVCQSQHFMTVVADWPGGAPAWQQHVLLTLKKHTDRQIVVRHWSSDKTERAQSLRQDLEGAWALVTHMSAAANEAILAGVPAFVTGPCAALEMGLSQIERIEHPRRPDGRQEWAARLAASQWTLDELRSGFWRAE
jgi:hypothetical protein